MKKGKPLVSVIMPVHNAALFLKDSIESILNQSFDDYELIIVENGSKDNSLKIIEEYKKKDKRIKVVSYEYPLGHAGEKASNEGIKIALGKYVARMDPDDISETNRLKMQVEFLEDHKEIFLVGSWAEVINYDNQVIGKRRVAVSSQDIWDGYYLRNQLINPSVMFRNTIASKEFYSLDYFPRMNDYYTYFLLMKSGLKFWNLPKYLIKYRINTKGSTYSNLRRENELNMSIKRRFLKSGYKPPILHRLLVIYQYLMIKMVPEVLIMRAFMFFPNK